MPQPACHQVYAGQSFEDIVDLIADQDISLAAPSRIFDHSSSRDGVSARNANGIANSAPAAVFNQSCGGTEVYRRRRP